MKKSDLGHGSNDEKRKDLSRDIVPHHSRLEEEKLRRRREWMIQQKRQREHEELKKKKILEYEMKRSRQIGASNSRGRSMKERDTKTKTTDRTLDKAPVQKTAATTSNSSVMAEKLDTSSSRGSTTIFQGPEGIKISEEELHRIKVDICRNLTVKTPQSKLNRDIINPEDVVIIRRNGEGSKPIFEREEIQNTSKKVEEIKERRTVMTVESGDTGNRSESYRRRSSSPNLLRHHSRRSSSPRRSKSKESKDSNCRSDWTASKRSDRRRSVERYHPIRDRRNSEYRSTSRNRYRSSRNRESSDREYKDYRRDSYIEQHYSHRNESRRRDDNEEESSSSNRPSRPSRPSRPRNHSSSRERRSRSRSRSRDSSRYRERQMIPSYCIDQMPYSVFYGPRPMMVRPMMPIRGQLPIVRGRLPHTLIRPIRPFLPRFMPPNVFRLGPPSNYRFGPMF